VQNLGGHEDLAVVPCQKRKTDDIQILMKAVTAVHAVGYPVTLFFLERFCFDSGKI